MVKPFNKIFGIGFHKTGVTSLAMALSILGFKANKGITQLEKSFGRDKCLKALEETDYQFFIDFMDTCDATVDNPWYILYKELDAAFPNSKFILTVREEQQWLRSCQHFFKGKQNRMHEFIYGQGINQFEGNESIYLKRYQQHIESVKHYFNGRESDLLVVNWEKGSGWQELCDFLNKPIITLPFPHANRQNKVSERL